jgi:hypothetical protein
MCKKNASMVCNITLKISTFSKYISSNEWKKEVYTAAFILPNSNLDINTFYWFYKMLLSI